MTAKEIISTWRWRIIKAGFKNYGAFAKELRIQPALLSLYMTGKKSPSVKKFDLIETTLRNMGV